MKKITIAALFTALLLPSLSSHAQKLPLWEAGASISIVNIPLYRGSKTDRSYALPYPYLIYRGKSFNIDEGGVRGHILHSKRIKLDFSLAGGLPVSNDNNSPRAGMPRLDPTVEFGPSLEIHLWQQPTTKHKLWLKLPLRAVYSINTPLEHQGWVFAPYLEYAMGRHNKKAWKGSLAIGALYADNAYHDYFYGVAKQYTATARPRYQANGGYSGSRITLVAQKQFDTMWLAAFARYDSLAGAVFLDSPLVETKNHHILGVAMTWVLAKSKTLAEQPEQLHTVQSADR